MFAFENNILETITLENKRLCKIMSHDFIIIDILIPNEQRIRDDNKVDEIVEYNLTHLKEKGYCNFMGCINIHFCEENNNMYLVDGQHRYEAIRKIKQNIKIVFELVTVPTMNELKINYKIINKNTPLPEFPEMIDKNIPEEVAKYFKRNYPDIWSKNSRARRPHIYFNYFQEALGIIVEELNIKNKDDLLQLIVKRNDELSSWKLDNYPDNKNITTSMIDKCVEHKIYLGLYKHVSDEFRYDWVRDIIKIKTGKDIKKSNNGSKKKNISKSLKTFIWDKHIGKDARSAYCICCVNEEIKVENFHAGHIISENHGGKTIDNNLLPVCSGCNASMGTLNMGEFVQTNFPSNSTNFDNRKYTLTKKKRFGFM
jgi:hypothetical protein